MCTEHKNFKLSFQVPKAKKKKWEQKYLKYLSTFIFVLSFLSYK